MTHRARRGTRRGPARANQCHDRDSRLQASDTSEASAAEAARRRAHLTRLYTPHLSAGAHEHAFASCSEAKFRPFLAGTMPNGSERGLPPGRLRGACPHSATQAWSWHRRRPARSRPARSRHGANEKRFRAAGSELVPHRAPRRDGLYCMRSTRSDTSHSSKLRHEAPIAHNG